MPGSADGLVDIVKRAIDEPHQGVLQFICYSFIPLSTRAPACVVCHKGAILVPQPAQHNSWITHVHIFCDTKCMFCCRSHPVFTLQCTLLEGTCSQTCYATACCSAGWQLHTNISCHSLLVAAVNSQSWFACGNLATCLSRELCMSGGYCCVISGGQR